MAFGSKGSRTALFTSTVSSRDCLSPCGSAIEAGLRARVSCLPETSCAGGSGVVAQSKGRRRQAFSGDSLGWGDLPQDALMATQGLFMTEDPQSSPHSGSSYLTAVQPWLQAKALENTLLESITETPSYLARPPPQTSSPCSICSSIAS